MPGPSELMQEASVLAVQICVVGSGTCLGAEEDQRQSRRTAASGWSGGWHGMWRRLRAIQVFQ